MKRALTTFIFLLLIGFGYVLPQKTYAAENSVVPSASDFGAIVDRLAPNGNLSKVSKEVYSVNTQANYMNGATCLLVGCSANKTSAFYYRNSALAQISNGIVALYTNPPADLALWMRDTGQSLGFLPKQAYAQGVGFSGLAPLLPLWKAFRNIAYLLLALAMIIIGFMVMFRQKIDPKTVVTVQNALPRIVITMLLITFSYAIVGFMIDITYLIIAFINVIVSSSLTGADALIANLTSGGVLSLFAAVVGPSFFLLNISPLSAGPLKVTGDVVFGVLSNLLTYGLFTVTTNGVTLGAVFQLILAVVFIFAFFRILFMLLGSYIQILIAVLIGPIQILTDVFPGSNGFSGWILNLVSNLMVFPITIFLLLLGNVISQSFTKGQILWTPPLLPQPLGGQAMNLGSAGSVDLSGLPAGNGDLTYILISLGIILTIPTVVKSLRAALKAKPPIEFGGGGGGLMQMVSSAYYLRSMVPQQIWEKMGFKQQQHN